MEAAQNFIKAINQDIDKSVVSVAQFPDTLLNLTGQSIWLRPRGHDGAAPTSVAAAEEMVSAETWAHIPPRKEPHFVKFMQAQNTSIAKTLPMRPRGEDGPVQVINVYSAEKRVAPVFSQHLNRVRCPGLVVPVYIAAWWSQIGQAELDKLIPIGEKERRISVYTASRISRFEHRLRIWHIEV